MLTFYVAPLLDSDGNESFKTFALRCARAFGALVEMREQPLSNGTPRELPSIDLTYYQRQIQKEERELTRLLAFADSEKREHGQRKINADIIVYENMLVKDHRENEILNAMIEKVDAWRPPTADHVELQKFMHEQLTICLNNDSYARDAIAKLKAKNPLNVYQESAETCQSNIIYNRKQITEKTARHKDRNEWVKQLWDSLEKPVVKAGV